MRLIHTTTFKLHEFFENQIPIYAILSHRWEEEEVTFQDMQAGCGLQMKGWAKINGCCAQAARDGFDYAWIDSCCIDKSSSAELSEAINSMYRWYSEAQVCYAFLSDVPSSSSTYVSDPRQLGSPFRSSKWFTRGWTLQELLAPTSLIFFDQNWNEIGTKSSLKEVLESITGVKVDHLFKSHRASVAQKMSWAAIRETTRVEDQAYCLMGLFQVNMPPLYGEGRRAFHRLQLEILRTSDDASIFAWSDPASGHWRNQEGGTDLLATSPSQFLDSGEVVSSRHKFLESPYLMTNRGLQIEVSLMSDRDKSQAIQPARQPPKVEETSIIVPLACRLDGDRLAVLLQRNTESTNQFHRYPGQTLMSMTELYRNIQMKAGMEVRTIYVTPFQHPGIEPWPATVVVETQSLHASGYEILQRHLCESGEPKWNSQVDLTEQDWSLHVKSYEKQTVWDPNPTCPSLLLVFKNGSERVSLQIFIFGKRVGLNIVTAKHNRHQDKERIFWDHVRPWQNDGDRVSKRLLDGGWISASVKNIALDMKDNLVAGSHLQQYANQPRQPGHVVSVSIDAGASTIERGTYATSSRSQQRYSALESDGSPTSTWTTTIPRRDRVRREISEFDRRRAEREQGRWYVEYDQRV